MRPGAVAVAFALLVAAGCGDPPVGSGMKADAETATDRITKSKHVLLIAHRGASDAAPENTIPAFEEALALFVDLVELDYRHSKDGVPVVMHDATLDRTTDAKQRWGATDIGVHAKTLEALRTLDAGSWFDPKFRGTRVPTLGEAVRTIEFEALPLIERKAGDAKTLVDWLKKRDCTRAVVVQSFDWDFLRACRELAPDLALGALGKESVTDEDLERIRASGAVVVGWRAKDLDEATIQRFHAQGLKVWAYTVDERAKARLLVSRGVDGIITNAPAVVAPGLE